MRGLPGVLFAMLYACGPAGAPEAEMGAGSPESLGSSLAVRVMGDSVRLEVHVTNVTDGPVALEFPTTQRYDFEVSERGGERIWRWSDGQMFGQALGREVLDPGESRRYEASWAGGGREGEYVATARVVAENHPVELRTEFRLPE